jgi:cobalamin synthase
VLWGESLGTGGLESGWGDPHVGTMAVVGVVLVLMLKYASLNALPDDAMLPTLVLMSTLSCFSMVQLASFSPYARASGGVGEPFVRASNVNIL